VDGYNQLDYLSGKTDKSPLRAVHLRERRRAGSSPSAEATEPREPRALTRRVFPAWGWRALPCAIGSLAMFWVIERVAGF
jgi:hypothetical protein